MGNSLGGEMALMSEESTFRPESSKNMRMQSQTLTEFFSENATRLNNKSPAKSNTKPNKKDKRHQYLRENLHSENRRKENNDTATLEGIYTQKNKGGLKDNLFFASAQGFHKPISECEGLTLDQYFGSTFQVIDIKRGNQKGEFGGNNNLMNTSRTKVKKNKIKGVSIPEEESEGSPKNAVNNQIFENDEESELSLEEKSFHPVMKKKGEKKRKITNEQKQPGNQELDLEDGFQEKKHRSLQINQAKLGNILRANEAEEDSETELGDMHARETSRGKRLQEMHLKRTNNSQSPPHTHMASNFISKYRNLSKDNQYSFNNQAKSHINPKELKKRPSIQGDDINQGEGGSTIMRKSFYTKNSLDPLKEDPFYKAYGAQSKASYPVKNIQRLTLREFYKNQSKYEEHENPIGPPSMKKYNECKIDLDRKGGRNPQGKDGRYRNMEEKNPHESMNYLTKYEKKFQGKQPEEQLDNNPEMRKTGRLITPNKGNKRKLLNCTKKTSFINT